MRRPALPRRVLFLCTANYYRSRFAEILLNELAARANLPWRAFSRALAIEKGACNPGPISPHAAAGCRARGIPLPDPLPFPCGASYDDFTSAERIIALKEAEHRSYVERHFARFADRVEYWHVHDLDAADPQDICAAIENQVRELLRELAAQGAGSQAR